MEEDRRVHLVETAIKSRQDEALAQLNSIKEKISSGEIAAYALVAIDSNDDTFFYQCSPKPTTLLKLRGAIAGMLMFSWENS